MRCCGLFVPSTDLSVFNVTVDPKAIEAAANDEATPPVSSEAPVLANEGPTASDDTNHEGNSDKASEWEVVHEEGDSHAVAEKASQAATASSAASKPSASLWPEVAERGDSHDTVDPTLGDDLYLHQDDHEAGNATATTAAAAAASTTDADSNLGTATKPASTKVTRPLEKQPIETAAISLVPTKKTKQKSKRVKFRSAVARKRKSG